MMRTTRRPPIDAAAGQGAATGRRARRPRSRGQSLVEFSLILPVFMIILGGVIQYGLILWAQNTIQQIANDTGRWGATQLSCPADGSDVEAQAVVVAGASNLFGWSGSFVTN